MRQPRLCALTQYTRAIHGRAHTNPITPATHLSHAVREASPNYTCFGLLSFGSRNKLCVPLFSLPLSLSISLFLPLPRLLPCSLQGALVCLALVKTSRRASLPHPQATPRQPGTPAEAAAEGEARFAFVN